jgi:hypothetical protein
VTEQPFDEADIERAERVARGESRHKQTDGDQKAKQRFELTRFNAVLLSPSAAYLVRG